MAKLVELLVIPAPGMGHLVSILNLAKLLLQKNESISISILLINFSNYSAKTNAYVNVESRDNRYPTRLKFLTFPPLRASPSLFGEVVRLYKPIVRKFIEDRVKNGFPKLVGIILDMFCGTMVDVANELDVPSYIFFTSGTSLLNFIFHVGCLADDHGLQARDLSLKISDPELSLRVPGFKNPITKEAIGADLKDENGAKMIYTFAKQFRKAKGILVNSYIGLETFAIESLRDGSHKNIPTVYPVGPILELKRKGGDEIESIMEWLNSQPESSIVFLCFGSMGTFKKEQVKEIANGLAQSRYGFLWALRKPPCVEPPSDNETFLEALPEGFLDRTCDRGKIIGWAPQVDVLAHPAIGGFVSHCGWNSTLESLWVGVPMATCPMYAEQQLNAFELVKELDLAVEIHMDSSLDRKTTNSEFLVKASEIEEGIKKLINMDENIKENLKKTSEEGKKALQDGGSSAHWLGRFIEDVLNNVK